MLTSLLFIIVALLAGAVLKLVLKRSPIPYTVGLFLAGLLVGILDRTGVFSSTSVMHSALGDVANTDPETLLYLFLPILIFDAAYEMNLHIFRKSLINALILSIPGVIVAMFLTGGLLMLLQHVTPEYGEWNWTIALMFGALISATDPVAVVSLLKELNTSKRFSTLVDAESLLNDGTGIVLFMIFFSTFQAGGSSMSPVENFFFVVFGGIIVGLVLAAVCLWIILRLKGDSSVQNSAIILSSYLTFYLCQSYLDVSGVIALVCFGLTIAYYGKLKLSSNVTTFVGEFWELAAYIANTLIFIIVGVLIALRVDMSWNNVLALVIVYVGLSLIRGIMVFLFRPIMRHFGYGLTSREGVILTWGGLRGAVGLTLGLMVTSVPAIPEVVREQVLFLTAGVVALTLTINATSMSWLLRKLGLTRHSLVETVVDHSVSGRLRSEMESYLADLKKQSALEGADWTAAEACLPEKNDVSGIPDIDDALVQNTVRIKVLEQENILCWKLYNDGVITRRALRVISDMTEIQSDADGSTPFTQQQSVFGEAIKQQQFDRVKWFPWLNRRLNRRLERKVVSQYEVCRGFNIVQRAAQALLDEIDKSSSFPEGEKGNLNVLRAELDANIAKAKQRMTYIAETYPTVYTHALTLKVRRMMQRKERSIISRYREEGYITGHEAQTLNSQVG